MRRRTRKVKRRIRPKAEMIVNGERIVCFTRKVRKRGGVITTQGYCHNLGPVKKPKRSKS